MKQITKRAKMIMLAMLMSFAVPMMVYSQPPPPDADDVDTPFDGGISLVLAAGAVFGAKQMRKKKS